MKIEYLKNNQKHSKGFTVLEIVAVIIVIGILSAVAFSRISSTQSYSSLSEADILKMHLRYAQLRALGDDATWGISFAGGSYTLLRGGSTAPYNLPNEDSPTHTLPTGLSVTGDTVTFDEWGIPVDASETALTNPINITLGGQTITVTKETGFIS